LTNILGNFLLIPKLGAIGAAIVTCATAIMWNSLMIWMSWRRMRIFTFLRPSLFLSIFRKE
jgi:O-antigen/teichoic acid export membrane protein